MTHGRPPETRGPSRLATAAIALLWILAFAFFPRPTYAIADGEPPVARFVPDIDVDQQNFAIAQDADSVLYIGNGRGVLRFDGERWQLIRLPNGDLVRSLAFDGGHRIYVGGYNAFGYLDHDDAGIVQFHDLTPLYRTLLKGEDFADIWHILVTPQGVLFGAVRHLFLYRPDSAEVRLWREPGRFGAMALSDGTILVQFRGEGLRRYENGGWLPLPGTAALNTLISAWVSLPGGGLLSLSADGHWNEWVNGHVQDSAMPDGSPPSSLFTTGLALADGSLAFSATDGSVRIFDSRQKQWRRLGIDSGWLAGLIVDRNGGLLTVGNQAVFHIGWPGAWTLIGRSAGISGLIYQLRHWQRHWYALGESGAHVDDPAHVGDPLFRRLDWTDHEAWDLLPIDANHALFAESYKLKLIENGRLRALEDHGDLYPRRLLRSRFDPSLVYVGTEFGVALVGQSGADWRLLIDRGSHASSVTGMIETQPNEVWFGSERDGIHRVRFAPDHSRLIEDRVFGKADGIAYDPVPAAAIGTASDGSLLASTNEGLYRWNGSRFEPAAVDGLASLRLAGELLRFSDDGHGNQWAYSARHIYHRRAGQSWQAEEVGDIIDGAIASMAFDDDGTALFNCTDSILRYGNEPTQGNSPVPAIRLSSVQHIDKSGKIDPLALRLLADPAFVRGDFGLEFRFALPDFRSRRGTQYQARLLGHDDRYSDWSHATRYLYRHLEAGDYVFEARARDNQDRISETPPYRFTIKPPWYVTNPAWVLWIALLVDAAGSLSYAAFGMRLLRKSKHQLEQLVVERTQALEAANRRLEALAHVDDLTAVANRRGLENWLRQAWQRCGEHQRPMALMIIDIDHFKEYNDRHGHLAGDELLRQIVPELAHCLRRSEDMIGRYGGDEFVAVLPGADLQAARGVAEAMQIRLRYSKLGTISVGIASRPPSPGEEVSQLLRDADSALYESKRLGRDRISVYGETAA